ncbi:MAG: DNA-directed RNA polymerase subunit alpha [Planctomycetes bacterium]|jgi:DNA-directed RNA polymerase subunit alpha|nr:DNA-directed RNA polymerase subunit alpha [Planctomycetota bacterium]
MRIRWRNLEIPSRVLPLPEKSTERFAEFIAEPFERGFGVTVGNSLRRILLSSIEGTAVTAIRIRGVKHEFSTLPGVIEDVTEIVLNLKRLLVRLHTDKPKVLKLEVKRKGPVTAADLVGDSEAEVVNPDLPLCTLSDSVPFAMDLDVRRGRGYVTAEENQPEEPEIGTIYVDSVFTPVHRVKYWTENTRVGKRTNYDRLHMAIWTNGTIAPENALVEASKILRKHLNPFVQFHQAGEEIDRDKGKDEGEQEGEKKQEILDKINRPVSDLDLSVRASNCLEAEGITTIRDLVSHTEDEMLEVRNFGKTSLKEVKKKLGDLGLDLGMDLAWIEESGTKTS